MSNVTDIIFSTACGENKKFINELNQYLEKHHNRELEKVDQYAGGDRHMQREIYMAAINYLNVESFLDIFNSTKSDNQHQCIQLLLKDEHDEKFTLHERHLYRFWHISNKGK
jgi:hypothetical protein